MLCRTGRVRGPNLNLKKIRDHERKIIEDGLVVGFLTETNQFVQIYPPTQPIDSDGIESVKHSSYAMKDGKHADMVLSTDQKQEEKRISTTSYYIRDQVLQFVSHYCTHSVK